MMIEPEWTSRSDPPSELPSMVSVGVEGRSPTSEVTNSSISRRAIEPPEPLDYIKRKG